MRKCRSRLHWIARIVLLLSVDLDRRCVVRIWDLSHSHRHIQTADHANANRSYRWEDWRWWFEARFRLSYPPCAREEFECHFSCSPCAEELGRHFLLKVFVLLAQVSSAAILFAENRYTEQFFFHGKKIFNEKKFFLRIFFLKLENQVQKFPGRTKIADFRKNAEDWKHWLICQCWQIRLSAYMPMLANKVLCLYANVGK